MNESLSRQAQLLLMGLLALVSIVYWPGLTGGFAFDDFANIVFNPALRVTSLQPQAWIDAALSSHASDLQRPLAMLSFAVNHYFTGLDPRPMKMTNLVIHLLNTGLVFGLVRSLLLGAIPVMEWKARERFALFVAACWALLPINLLGVLLVVQRMESLCHVFVFAGLWLYAYGRLRQLEGRTGWRFILLGVLACTGLGVFSKESAVLLPLYAFFLELFVFRFQGPEGERKRLMTLYAGALFLPAALGSSWLLSRALGPGAYARRDFNLVERLLTESRVVLDYFHWTIAPNLSQLSLFHDDYLVSRGVWSPPATLFALIALSGLVGIAWWARRKRPLTSLGLAWFLGAQLLTATVVPLELVFEHRNYFASLGLMLALADLLLVASLGSNLRRAGTILATFVLLFYTVSTHLRARDWSNPLQFARSEAEKHPQSPRATYQLAQVFALLSNGDPKSPFTAAAFAAFEDARQVPRANILPAQGALLLAARTGAPLKTIWWRDIQRRLRQQPIGPQELGALSALTDCAIALRCPFPADEMMETYAAGLSQGDNPEVLNTYANFALNVLRDPELSERLWKEASRITPREPQYVISLAKLMIALRREDEARQQIRKLRAMGRLQQYQVVADSLDIRLRNAMRTDTVEN